MSVGVAVIGCGLVAKKRCAALPRDAEILAVFDLETSRADSLAAHVGRAVVVASDPNEAFAVPGVDLVLVATAHRSLAPLARQAVLHGHHVLVEKPGAAALGPLLELEAAAATAGTQVRVGYNHRFHPSLLQARELVTNGAHGRVLHLRGRYGHGGRIGYEHEWRADRSESGGGELLDQGVHLIDLTRYLCGDVELAFAELRTDFWPIDVEDNAFFALRTNAGAFAWLHASWTEWKNMFSLEVVLERAKLEITGLGGSYGTETLRLHEMSPEMGPPLTTSWEWPGGDGSWERELEDVLAAIDGRTSIGASIDDAVATLRIVDEAYRS